MQPHTKREEIKHFLKDYFKNHSYAPSVREIMAGVGLSSTASVQYHLQALQREGFLRMGEGRNRSITLSAAPVKVARIPLIGVVRAGQPILAVENIEAYLPWDGEEDCFALRVKGDSMMNAGILEGDVLIVRQQSDAEHGQIVVALLDNEATVKRLSRRNGEVWLLPENPAYEPIDGRNAQILGRVKAVIRRY